MGHKRMLVFTFLSVSVGAAFIGTLWNAGDSSLQGQVAALHTTVIDNGDPGFTTLGEGWQSAQNNDGYGKDFTARNSLPNQSFSANWTFTNIEPGRYRILITFKAYKMLSNSAPYTVKQVDVSGKSSVLATAAINQMVDPTGNPYDGKSWTSLGEFAVTGSKIVVSLMPKNAPGTGKPLAVSRPVIADAVRIERLPSPVPPPKCGNGVIDLGEECDGPEHQCPANANRSCSTSCRCVIDTPKCGNGRLDLGEECDNGNSCAAGPYQGAACQSNSECTGSETCTNGWCPDQSPCTQNLDCQKKYACSYNTLADPTCSNLCKRSLPAPVCGNNRTESPEKCDGTDRRNCLSTEFCASDCTCSAQPPLPSALSWNLISNPDLFNSLSDFSTFTDQVSMYVVGGRGFSGPQTTVSESRDGINWNALPSLPRAVSNAAATSLQGGNGAFLIGGLTDGGASQTVFGSRNIPDGFVIMEATLPAPRYNAATLRIGDLTFVLGGIGPQETAQRGSLLGSLLASLLSQQAPSEPSLDVFVSREVGWGRLSNVLPFPVTKNNAFAIDDTMFIVNFATLEIRQSQDGTTWNRVGTFPSGFSGIQFLRPILHNGSLWLIAKSGFFAGSALVTSNGTDWQRIRGIYPIGLAGFVPAEAVSFGGELWLFGSLQDMYSTAHNGRVLRTGTALPPICTEEGRTMAVIPGVSCCTGLSSINPAKPAPDGSCPLLVGSTLCSRCGNGTCEEWENICNCVQDCKGSAPECAQSGKTVFISTQFGPTVCCSKNAGVKPNAILDGNQCYSPSNGSIGTCVDNWWLTCGDGTCKGEDMCTCPKDCPKIPPSTSSASSVPCPMFSAPMCQDGILIPQTETDARGCPLPPVCCAGANAPQAKCSLTMTCASTSCMILSCSCSG